MKCHCATLNPLAGATRLNGENVCRHAVILHMFRTQLRFSSLKGAHVWLLQNLQQASH